MIEDKVITIICEQLNVRKSDVKPAAAFITDLGASELDVAELLMTIEDNFDIQIPDAEKQKINTVKAAVDYVKQAVNG